MVGILDWITGADYMLLRYPPPTPSLLSAPGPWPWFVFGAAGVGLAGTEVTSIPRGWALRGAPVGWATMQVPQDMHLPVDLVGGLFAKGGTRRHATPTDSLVLHYLMDL